LASPLRYAEWSRRLEQQGPASAQLLCGPDSWLRDSALAAVRRRLFPGQEQVRLGQDRFYGGEGPLAQVTLALASVGLFTGRRLVVASAVEKWGRAAAADRRELIGRLGGGLEGSTFVGLSELPLREFERKNELTRELMKVCQVVDLSHPTAAEAMRWLLDESRRRGLALQAEAGEYLLSRVGPDLQELARELEKLELAVPAGDRIGRERIEEMIRRGELGSGWQLSEAALEGRAADGLRLWSAVRRAEPVLRTQWLLQRQARDRLVRPAPLSPPERMRALLQRAYELERGIKTGRIPSGLQETAMELLLAATGAGGSRPGSRPRS